MNDESEELRVSRARDLAFEEGRRRERVDGRLNGHEARLNAINGSIDRFDERLARVEGAMATNDAIEEALMKVADRSGAKRFSNVQAFGIYVLACTAVGAFVLSIVTALAHA